MTHPRLTSSQDIICLMLAINFLTFTSAEAAITRVALEGEQPPDANGNYASFSIPLINNSGQAAFHAGIAGTDLGTLDNAGLFRGNGTDPLFQVARKNQAVPGGGNILSFNSSYIAINDSDQIAFRSFLQASGGVTADNNDRIYRASSNGALVEIASESDTVPDNGKLLNFGTLGLSFNNNGEVAFRANLTETIDEFLLDTIAIYTGDGGPHTQIARTNHDLTFPGFGGPFTTTVTNLPDLIPSVNDDTQVAFRSSIQFAHLPSDERAIMLADGSTATRIVSEGMTIGGDSGFTHADLSLTTPAINSTGHVAFRSLTEDLPGPVLSETQFIGDGNEPDQIASRGDSPPEGNGTLDLLLSPSINDSNQTAFRAVLSGTALGTIDNSGLYRGSSSGITTIARENNTAPDGNGKFDDFQLIEPALNNTGQVAFTANLKDTATGTSDDKGLYISDGIETVTITRKGQTLLGNQVTDIQIINEPDKGGRSPINDHGQVAFRATVLTGTSPFLFQTEGIYIYTPDLRFRGTFDGPWDNAQNWTLGILPAFVHDITIDPDTDRSIDGPTDDTDINSLILGVGTGIATLDLQGSTVTINDGFTIDPNGRLTGTGIVDAELTNNGTIEALGTALTLINGPITNTGDINGSTGGTISIENTVVDNAAGNIHVDPTSILNLNDATITGGSITGGGTINLTGTNATLQDIGGLEPPPQILDTILTVVDGQILNIDTRELQLDGTIRLAATPGGSPASILGHNMVVSPDMITGSGRIEFTTNADNLFDANGAIDIGPDITIASLPGARGFIGAPLNNAGNIDADDGTLTLDLLDKTNSGLIQARNGGTITADNIDIDNTDGTISIDPPSTLNLNDVTITGGSIIGGGTINLTGTSATLQGPAGLEPPPQILDAILNVVDGQTLNLNTQELQLDGTIRLVATPGGDFASVVGPDLAGPNMIAGTGRIEFATDADNFFDSFGINPVNLGTDLTVATLPGAAGFIGASVISAGTLEADGGTLTLDLEDKTNTGLIQARNSGTLNIKAITIDNTSGTFNIDPTSILNIADATIIGGSISGGGTVNLTGTTATLRGPAGLEPPPQILNTTLHIAPALLLTIEGESFQLDGSIRLEGTPANPAMLETINPTGPAVATIGTGRIEFVTSGLLPNGLDVGTLLTVDAHPGATAIVQGPMNNRGMLLANGFFSFESGGTLTNDITGTVAGSGTIALNASAFTNLGLVSSGPQPEPPTITADTAAAAADTIGILTIDGDFTQAATGTTHIEIADPVSPSSPTPGLDYDQLSITGSATLAGTLEVDLQPDPAGFNPDLATTYQAITFADRGPIGAQTAFDTITGTLIRTDLALAPLFDANALFLRASVPGDLNLDNKVSVADLSSFALNFNTNPGLYDNTEDMNSWQLGDFNSDGAITVADLSLLALNFGFDATAPASSSIGISLLDAANFAGIDLSTIPEPSTMTLIGVLSHFIFAHRRRQH